MNITQEAVDAAAKALFTHQAPETADPCASAARSALEAAAPFMTTGAITMTPTEVEHLRDLFYAARQTTRDAVLGRPEAYSADDAATEAFNTALREYTKH